jgi:hypothetical protein
MNLLHILEGHAENVLYSVLDGAVYEDNVEALQSC